MHSLHGSAERITVERGGGVTWFFPCPALLLVSCCRSAGRSRLGYGYTSAWVTFMHRVFFMPFPLAGLVQACSGVQARGLRVSLLGEHVGRRRLTCFSLAHTGTAHSCQPRFGGLLCVYVLLSTWSSLRSFSIKLCLWFDARSL